MPLPIATPAVPGNVPSGVDHDATFASGDFAALLALLAGAVPAPTPVAATAPTARCTCRGVPRPASG